MGGGKLRVYLLCHLDGNLSVIYAELIFVYGVNQGSSFFLFYFIFVHVTILSGMVTFNNSLAVVRAADRMCTDILIS